PLALAQLALKPLPARERLFAHGGRVEDRAVERGSHDLHVVAGGALASLALACAEEIEVAPAHAAQEAHASAVARLDDESLALEHADAQVFAARAQLAPCAAQLASVELMVARHEDDRHRPAREAREAVPAGVDVARKHEQFGAARRTRREVLGLEVQVRQELDQHAAAARSGVAAPVAELELLAAAAGAGIVAPDLRSRAAHRLDLQALAAREVRNGDDVGDEVLDRRVQRLQRMFLVQRVREAGLLVGLLRSPPRPARAAARPRPDGRAGAGGGPPAGAAARRRAGPPAPRPSHFI